MASQVAAIKWVPGTSFIVDGFAFQSPKCSHYFLTHFHSDHTVGLSRGFKGGVIYCSHVTARLLVHDMGLRPEVVRPLSVGTPVVIADVRVTPLDANHCPGAVMFLFEVPQAGQPAAPPTGAVKAPAAAVAASTDEAAPGAAAATAVSAAAPIGEPGSCGGVAGAGVGCGGAEGPAGAPGGEPRTECGGEGFTAGVTTHNILHTGDCRWQPWMRQQPGLAGVRVDTLFLDTTYAAPKHTHPPQQQAIDSMVQAMREAAAEEPRTLFLLAAYHIGKERAFLGAAQQLGVRVWVSDAKRSVMRLLDLPPQLTALLADDPRDADLHVTGWGLRPEDVRAYLDQHPGVWKRAVGLRPTGWTFRRNGGLSVRRDGDVTIIGVPYSEHSSWPELCDAVSQLRPRRLVPTVNASSPARRRALVDLFARLMDLSGDRSRLDVYLLRGGAAGMAGRPGAAAAGALRTEPAARAAAAEFGGCHAAGGRPELIDLSKQDGEEGGDQESGDETAAEAEVAPAGSPAEAAAPALSPPPLQRLPHQAHQQELERDEQRAEGQRLGRPGRELPAAGSKRGRVSPPGGGGGAGCRPAKMVQLAASGSFVAAAAPTAAGTRRGVCVVDLTGDEDGDDGDGDDGSGEAGKPRGAGRRSAAPERAAAAGAAPEGQLAAVPRGRARALGTGCLTAVACQAGREKAAEGPRGHWQSSIRRFFEPVRRIAAALV